MAQDWDIRSRSERCAACGGAFEDQQIYVSALFQGEDGFARSDFCMGCWEPHEHAQPPFSAWHGIFRKPPANGGGEPLKKETAESLLRKLIEDEDPALSGVIYILAVMLERKKILMEKDVTIDDDHTVHRIYEHRQSGETFMIFDPQLKLDKLEDVQITVVEMLGGPLPSKKTVAEGTSPADAEAQESTATLP